MLQGVFARYIRALCAKGIGWACVLVCALVWNASFVVEVRRLHESATFIEQVWVATLLTPSRFVPYATLALVLALCLLCQRLHRERIWLAGQSLGVSRIRCIKTLLPVLALVSVLVFAVVNFLGPLLADKAHRLQLQYLSSGQMIESENDVWLKTKKGFLSAKQIDSAATLFNVNLYLYEGGELKELWQTNTAKHTGKGRWQSTGGIRRELFTNQGASEVVNLNQWILPISLKPQVLEWVRQRPTELRLDQLVKSLQYGEQWGLPMKFSWTYMWTKVLISVHMLLAATAVLWILFNAMAIGVQTSKTLMLAMGLVCVWSGGDIFILHVFLKLTEEVGTYYGFWLSVLYALSPSLLFLLPYAWS